jgi:hypothetical protein
MMRMWDSGRMLAVKEMFTPVYSAFFVFDEDGRYMKYRVVYIFGIRVAKVQVKNT